MTTEADDSWHSDSITNKTCAWVNGPRCFYIKYENDTQPIDKSSSKAEPAPGRSIKLRNEVSETTDNENEVKIKAVKDVCLMKISRQPVFLILVEKFQIPFWYSTVAISEISRLLDVIIRNEIVPLSKHLSIGDTIDEGTRNKPSEDGSFGALVLSREQLLLDSKETRLCHRYNHSDISMGLSIMFGCSLHLSRDTGLTVQFSLHPSCLTQLSQAPDNAHHQLIPLKEINTPLGAAFESLAEILHKKSLLSQRKHFHKLTSDDETFQSAHIALDNSSHNVQSALENNSQNVQSALENNSQNVQSALDNSSQNVQSALDNSSQIGYYKRSTGHTVQFSTDNQRSSTNRTHSGITCNHLVNTESAVHCHGSTTWTSGFDKSTHCNCNCREQSKDRVVNYTNQNVCCQDVSWRDFTGCSDNNPDISSSRPVINTCPDKWESGKSISKMGQNCRDYLFNRNNSSKSNKSRGNMKRNADGESNGDTSSSSSSSSDVDCSFGVQDEKSAQASQHDANNLTDVSSFEQNNANVQNLQEYSTPALDNSSNFTPTHPDSSTGTRGNIICQSLMRSPDRKKTPQVIHDDMFEAHSDYALTPRDVDILVEERSVDRFKSFEFENKHSFQPTSPRNEFVCTRKTRTPNVSELRVQNELNVIDVETDTKKANNVCLSDVTPCVTGVETILTRNACPVSHVGLCEAADQQPNKTCSSIPSYEGDKMFPLGNWTEALPGDSTERKTENHMTNSLDGKANSMTNSLDGKANSMTKAMDGQVNSVVSRGKVHTDRSKDSPARAVPTGGDSAQGQRLNSAGLPHVSLHEVKSIAFLNILTTRLLEIAGKEMEVSGCEKFTASSESNTNSQSGDILYKSLATSKSITAKDNALRSDKTSTFSKEDSQGQDIKLPRPKTSPKTVFPILTSSLSTNRPGVSSHCCDGHEIVDGKANRNTENKFSFAEDTARSSTPCTSHEKQLQDQRAACVHNVSSETSSLNQLKAYPRNSSKVQIRKHRMIEKDSDSRQSETRLFASSERQTIHPNAQLAATKDAVATQTDAANDVIFKVDIFKTVEYASSLSFGYSATSSYNGTMTCGQSNFCDDRHSPVLTCPRFDEMSGCPYDQCTAHHEEQYNNDGCSNVCNPNDGTETVHTQEEDTDSYSRARILRASQRRRKLMTELEEITSCADAYNWSRSDSRSHRHEPTSMFPSVDYTFSRNVTDLESASQQTDKRVVGTFTIEHLTPPFNGLVLLK